MYEAWTSSLLNYAYFLYNSSKNNNNNLCRKQLFKCYLALQSKVVVLYKFVYVLMFPVLYVYVSVLCMCV